MSPRFLNLFALAVLAGLLLLNSFVVVSEGERGILHRFGEAIRIGLPPGRYFHIPLVDRLQRVDMRLHRSDVGPGDYRDAAGRPMRVEAWVLWRVRDVPNYLRGTRADPGRAAVMLLPAVQEGLRRAFAEGRWVSHRQGLPAQLRRQIARDSSRLLQDALGVEVVDVRVRRFSPVPEERALLLRGMQVAREAEVQRLRTAATLEAESLRLAGMREREGVLRTARAAAAAEQRKAEASVATIAARDRRQAPRFYRFWRSLQTWRSNFGKPGDVFVLGSESELRAYRRKSKDNGPARGAGVPPR